MKSPSVYLMQGTQLTAMLSMVRGHASANVLTSHIKTIAVTTTTVGYEVSSSEPDAD